MVKKALLKERGKRCMQCFNNNSICKNLEDIKMMNIKFQVFNYTSYYIQNDLLSKDFRFATVSRFSVKDLKNKNQTLKKKKEHPYLTMVQTG